MDSFREQRQGAAALWARMLEPIPTLLGKLVSVASFRDGASNEYRHPTLYSILPPDDAHRVLCESHERLFAEWVGLFIDEQHDDLKRYLTGLREGGARGLLLKAREHLIPSSANPTAQRVFLVELEEILTADSGLQKDARELPHVA